MALAPRARVQDIETPIPHSLATYSVAGALVAGVLGATAFSFVLWLARLMGVTRFSTSLMFGSMFTGDESNGALWLGLIVSLVIGGLTALVYALLFHRWGWATWARGVAIGIPHAIIAGILMAMVPRVHPGGASFVHQDPGFLAGHDGWLTAVLMFFLFLLYGAIVGEVYSRYVPHLSPRTLEARTPLP